MAIAIIATLTSIMAGAGIQLPRLLVLLATDVNIVEIELNAKKFYRSLRRFHEAEIRKDLAPMAVIVSVLIIFQQIGL